MAIKIIHKKCGMEAWSSDWKNIFLSKNRDIVTIDNLVCIIPEKENKISITKKIMVGYKYVWDAHPCKSRRNSIHIDFPLSEYDIIEE